MKTIKIGVLGGIGPEATGIFYLNLIKKFQESGLIKRNEDFPQIIINSIPAPELISEETSKLDLKMYESGLKELDMHKPDFIVMVCNTIHIHHRYLQSKINAELLDLKEEVHKKIKSLKIKNLAVLGTPTTISSGLYKFDDVKYVHLTEDEIKLLIQAVLNFSSGIKKDQQIKNVNSIAEKYNSSGSDCVLLGCTEFAVMLKDSKISKLDTIDILVDSVVEKYKSLIKNKF